MSRRQGDAFVLKANPTSAVDARAYKMSKSRGNVINPDAVVKEYGADSLRLYEMFMGPLEAVKPWSMKRRRGRLSLPGPAWRMIIDDRAETIARSIHGPRTSTADRRDATRCCTRRSAGDRRPRRACASTPRSAA